MRLGSRGMRGETNLQGALPWSQDTSMPGQGRSGGEHAVSQGWLCRVEPDHVFRGETGRKKQQHSAENVNESRFILSLFKFSRDGVDLCVRKPNPATRDCCTKPATSPQALQQAEI